jgi:hypothetical protein
LMLYGVESSFGPDPLHQKEKGMCLEMVLEPSPDSMDDLFTVYFC